MTKARKRDPMTRDQRAGFLDMLAATANVTQSARAVGSSHQAAYRQRQASAGFRDGWSAALAEGYARLELKLLQRALGQEEELPEDVAPARTGAKEPSDRVILTLLAAHRSAVVEARAVQAQAAGGDDPRQRLIEKLRRMRAVAQGPVGTC